MTIKEAPAPSMVTPESISSKKLSEMRISTTGALPRPLSLREERKNTLGSERAPSPWAKGTSPLSDWPKKVNSS